MESQFSEKSFPVTEKISNDGQNEYISFGSSTMQGWRLEQEDALNCCAEFGINSSLFAVYDGHGGAEVALYCAKKLPDFLKSMEAYQKGNFEQAFKDAFIGFDSTLVQDDAVFDELKRLASDVGHRSEKQTYNDGDSDDKQTLAVLPVAAVDDKDLPTKQDINLGAELEKCKSKAVLKQAKHSRNRRLCRDADADSDTDTEDEDDHEGSRSKDHEADDEQNLEEEEEIETDFYYDDYTVNLENTPGYSSGCTAVVALLVGRELYVANAGDSRCVLCRNGKTFEMSLDHKPEDVEELLRITNAGGRVTDDGRVDGGLNLSRAIGDHLYKMNEDLKPDEQKISPVPDVKKIALQDDDEFMVLASDGIWNCMSSKEVVEFVRERLTQKRLKLSSICEELFTKCLEPNADGDMNGCDNMTAILVQFKQNFERTNNQTPTSKRRTDEELKNVPASDGELKNVPASDEKLKSVPASDEDLKNVPVSDEELKNVPPVKRKNVSSPLFASSESEEHKRLKTND